MRKRIAAALLAASAVYAFFPLHAHALEEAEVRELAVRTGREYGISPEFLQAVAWQESSYREDAEYGNCSGLMQVSGYWHKDRMEHLGVTDLHDPEGCMIVAADYFVELFEKYEDPGMVLMVYNGDSGAPGYQETGEGLSDYAVSILEMAERLERESGK